MIRIVKMHFQLGKTAEFMAMFEEIYPKISTFPGCKKLSLLRDKKTPEIFFTYSIWEGENDLENYRNSDLFCEVWKKTKAMFAHKAEAWSVDEVYGEEIKW
jgi:heme-degrading monooxygenase HmoA